MSTKIDKPTILKIIKEISRKMRVANSKVFKPNKIFLSNKNISEIIGKIAETTFAEMLTKKLGYQVKSAQSDKDPDLVFTKTGEEFEIKVASGDYGWQGGEFSRRPSEYFLISWGGDFDEFFVARTNIVEKEWYSHIAKRRYGTSYPAKDLYNKRKKIIYLGSLEPTPRGAIKIKREKLG